jgi:hypothetical protein
MATREIRIVVLDTTGPTEQLKMELCPWVAALALHGYKPNQLQNQPQKGRRRGLTRAMVS